jgi:hypothetical protein
MSGGEAMVLLCSSSSTHGRPGCDRVAAPDGAAHSARAATVVLYGYALPPPPPPFAFTVHELDREGCRHSRVPQPPSDFAAPQTRRTPRPQRTRRVYKRCVERAAAAGRAHCGDAFWWCGDRERASTRGREIKRLERCRSLCRPWAGWRCSENKPVQRKITGWERTERE